MSSKNTMAAVDGRFLAACERVTLRAVREERDARGWDPSRPVVDARRARDAFERARVARVARVEGARADYNSAVKLVVQQRGADASASIALRTAWRRYMVALARCGAALVD